MEHKWSPDEFVSNDSSGKDIWDLLEAPGNCTFDFVEDTPRGGAISYMNRLNQAERDAVYALVDERARAEIQTELQIANQAAETVRHQALQDLLVKLEDHVEEELHLIAKGAVELAIAMCEQIVKSNINLDRQTMLKRISSIIGRAGQGAELTVIANPVDLDYLHDYADELKRLNVVALIPDKGLDVGSCLVTSEGRQWDLTVSGQVEALSEMVRESILYQDDSTCEVSNSCLKDVEDEPALV